MHCALLILVVDMVTIIYMGEYGYANDVRILSPTLSGLKEMLNLCEDYAMEHKICFNASKVNRVTNLLAEFSHCDSGTLSTLFRTYCMNIIIYGC